MPDTFPVLITFGPVAAELAEEAKQLANALVCDAYADNGLEQLPDGTYLGRFGDGAASYGFWDENCVAIFHFCQEHNIPYLAQCDPKYEYDGEWCEYLNGETRSQGCDAEGNTHLSAPEWTELKATHGSLTPGGEPNYVAIFHAVEAKLCGFGDEHPTRVAQNVLATQKKAESA